MRDELLKLLKEHAYRKGEFKLSSGKKSEHYVNCKPVTLSAQGINLVSTLLLECISSDVVAVGGLTLGADPLVSGVAVVAGLDRKIINATPSKDQKEAHKAYLEKLSKASNKKLKW